MGTFENYIVDSEHSTVLPKLSSARQLTLSILRDGGDGAADRLGALECEAQPADPRTIELS